MDDYLFLKTADFWLSKTSHSSEGMSRFKKRNRVETTKELLKILNALKHEGFKNIVTGDQKWFTLYYANNGAWIESDKIRLK